MPVAKHVLDNPVWNALITGNKGLAHGTDAVKVFHKTVSPIVGLQEYTIASFDTLYELIPLDNPVVIFSMNTLSIPESWSVLYCINGFQMVYAGSTLPVMQEGEEITFLTDEHIPQMLSLTAQTNPGPFFSRTIDFGHYEGIYKDGQLVAMAGQRLHPYQYAEISAVCTHPTYTGKGYAKQLLLRQVQRIMAAGDVPFLHVKDDNSRAIEVYKSIGFEIRKKVVFYVLVKKDKQVAFITDNT